MALEPTDLFVVQSQTDSQLYSLRLSDLEAHLEASVGISFRGSIDLNLDAASQTPPITLPPINGDLYVVVSNAETINSDWVMDAGVTSAEENDRIVWDSSEGYWVLVSGGGNTGGTVIDITATYPLKTDGDTVEPVLSVSNARTLTNANAAGDGLGTAGTVARLAEAADVVHTNGTGDSAAVVTADLLKTTNNLVESIIQSGDTPTLQSVTDAGSNTTNSLTIDTDKIALNADGSAEFADGATEILANGTVWTGRNDAEQYAWLNKGGIVAVTDINTSGTGNGVIEVYRDGTNPANRTVRIDSNGSSTFADTVTSGSSTRRGQFLGNCPESVPAFSANAFAAKYNGVTKASIAYDGSADFVGDVTADAFIGDGSQLTNLPNTGGGDQDLESVLGFGNNTTNSITFGPETPDAADPTRVSISADNHIQLKVTDVSIPIEVKDFNDEIQFAVAGDGNAILKNGLYAKDVVSFDTDGTDGNFTNGFTIRNQNTYDVEGSPVPTVHIGARFAFAGTTEVLCAAYQDLVFATGGTELADEKMRLDATGDLTVSGTIEAEGIDGGTTELSAGQFDYPTS